MQVVFKNNKNSSLLSIRNTSFEFTGTQNATLRACLNIFVLSENEEGQWEVGFLPNLYLIIFFYAH
jgi:hypothetical protein